MTDSRPTENSVLGPVLEALGDDSTRLGPYINFYHASDPVFHLVFEHYMRRYTSLVPADETVTPEEVAEALRKTHAQELARRARNNHNPSILSPD